MKRFANRLRYQITGISSISSKQVLLKYKGAVRHLFFITVFEDIYVRSKNEEQEKRVPR